MKYRKVNPFVPVETNYPGDEFNVCKGPKGSVLGLMVCYDGDFPESARELAVKGANVIIRPSCYMEPYSNAWEFVNQCRAYENMSYLIAVNRGGTHEVYTWFGNSMVVDYDGKILTKLHHNSDCLTMVEIYPGLVDEIRKTRKECNHLHNLQHRGYHLNFVEGIHDNPYSFYKGWQ